MKAKVDHNTCIGCGLCAQICPEVFEIKEDDLAYVILDPVSDEFNDSTLDAESNCPVSAISHENN